MKSLVLFTFVALSQARFGQEQLPINAIRQVKGGQPGVSDTIAGAAISDLLAAADPCAKLQRGDQILTELGTGSDAVAAAIGMVAAEKNFNPFTSSQPSICGDPALPQNALLRGITPKIDPAVGGADVANALSARTISQPLQAEGKSVADLLSENGFTNFTTSGGSSTQKASKAEVKAGSKDDGSSQSATVVTPPPVASASEPPVPPTISGAPPSPGMTTPPPPPPPAIGIGNGTTPDPAAPPVVPPADGEAAANATIPDAAAAPPAPPGNVCTCTCTVQDAAKSAKGRKSKASATSTAGKEGKKQKGDRTGAAGDAGAAKNSTTEDFGSCNPTMSFQAGRPGRKATEFTFQSNDPVIAANQQDALNPNIITNRICDELTNICNANAAAKATCLSAKAQILALGTKDQSTADAWNALVGGGGSRKLRR